MQSLREQRRQTNERLHRRAIIRKNNMLVEHGWRRGTLCHKQCCRGNFALYLENVALRAHTDTDTHTDTQNSVNKEFLFVQSTQLQLIPLVKLLQKKKKTKIILSLLFRSNLLCSKEIKGIKRNKLRTSEIFYRK